MASFMIAALERRNQVERDHHRRSLPDGICSFLFPYALGLPLQLKPQFS